MNAHETVRFVKTVYRRELRFAIWRFRRKIGRDLISRGDSLHEAGEKVRVVAVEIAEI